MLSIFLGAAPAVAPVSTTDLLALIWRHTEVLASAMLVIGVDTPRSPRAQEVEGLLKLLPVRVFRPLQPHDITPCQV